MDMLAQTHRNSKKVAYNGAIWGHASHDNLSTL